MPLSPQVVLGIEETQYVPVCTSWKFPEFPLSGKGAGPSPGVTTLIVRVGLFAQVLEAPGCVSGGRSWAAERLGPDSFPCQTRAQAPSLDVGK